MTPTTVAPAPICIYCDHHIIEPSEVSKEYCSNGCASADGWFTGRD